MNGELLRLVDSIHRDKDIDKEIIFRGIEDALLSAARKRLGQRDSILVTIDRDTGDILAFDGDTPISPAELGRIAAQTAKQVIIQKIREAESEVIYDEFEAKVHDIINGTVQRTERSTVIVNLGKIEGILPRKEQVPDDTYRPGERIKCYVVDVRKDGQRVKVLLSRTHPDIVKRLFEMEVPEVADRIIEIKALVREPGNRTKIAVVSADSRVDCVGACVGVRGSRIKNIVAELGGEKIDIVAWSEQPEMFIAKALSPAEIYSITLNPALNRAKVVVPEDQLSLAIGKKGQNVRLAARLTRWDIDVMSKEEADHLAEDTANALGQVEGASEDTVGRLVRLGFTLSDLARISVEELTVIRDVSDEEAAAVIEAARDALAEAARKRSEEAAEAARKRSEEEAEPQPGEAAQAEQEAEQQEAEQQVEEPGVAQEGEQAAEAEEPEEPEPEQEEEEPDAGTAKAEETAGGEEIEQEQAEDGAQPSPEDAEKNTVEEPADAADEHVGATPEGSPEDEEAEKT